MIPETCGEIWTMTTPDTELNRLEASARAKQPARVPVDKGHFGISIDKDGVWSHGGTVFPRIQLARLFATVMKIDADGAYWLETPVERGKIDVADAPFVAVELAAHGKGVVQEIKFRDNLDGWTPLDAEHPLRIAFDAATDEPRPYVMVRNGLEARIARAVYYELADLVDETPKEGMIGVWSFGHFHPLGPAEDNA